MTTHDSRSMPQDRLPSLDADQAQHSQAVLSALRAALGAAGGWLSFAEYLQQVLYAPGLGYYSAGAAKLGRAGDFITAPELSPLFAHCLARQCAQVLRSLASADEPGDILELGAGSGRLAFDLLTALAPQRLPERYLILEVSADLRARQQQLLRTLPDSLYRRIRWLEALPAVPIRGILLANEVADALPFERFVVTAGGCEARGVALAGMRTGLPEEGALIIADRPASPALADGVAQLRAQLPELPAGYVSELCLLLEPWLASLAAVLERGAILLFDYGLSRGEYYHVQRSSGTLRCHFRHRAHDDPLRYPGLQDISAWVDFTRVAEAAADSGLDVLGYCTQAAFLLANGIEAQVASAADTITRARLASQARQLLLPGEMGENFKLMALGRDLPLELAAFEYQDLRRLL